jgi:UDP-glucose 4-epimerase
MVADITDSAKFKGVLTTYQPCGIVYTAALKVVGESISMPDEYTEVKFHDTTKMLELIHSHGTKKFKCSSTTTAIYGASDHLNPTKEDDEKNSISAYGASETVAEGEVNKFVAIPGNNGTSLRFF